MTITAVAKGNHGNGPRGGGELGRRPGGSSAQGRCGFVGEGRGRGQVLQQRLDLGETDVKRMEKAAL
jgi:hypothetical protein